MRKQCCWVVMLVCTLLAGALPSEAAPVLGYALGAQLPGEDIGNVAFVEAAPLAAPSVAPASDYAAEVVRLINLERKDAGLPPYKFNPVLAAIAVEHSVYMRDQDCFSHQCPGEVVAAQRACAAGYEPYGWGDCYIGETIAGGHATPTSVVAAWMERSAHRDILLHDKLREIGVGYVTGGYYGSYWTVDFGSQPNVVPVFINAEDAETDNPQVTLTLTNEYVSGWGGMDCADAVMIGNDPGFVDAQWEPYAPQKQWTLGRCGGRKTVYVKYRDPAGNQVISSDEILYNEPLAYDLQLATHSLTFSYEVDGSFWGTTALPVAISNGASCAPMEWSVDSSGGGTWLDVIPDWGSTPAQLTVSVAGFQTDRPGTHTALLTVTSPQDPGNAHSVTVTILARQGSHYRAMIPLVRGGGN